MCRYCQKTVLHSVSVVEGVQPIIVVSHSVMRWDEITLSRHDPLLLVEIQSSRDPNTNPNYSHCSASQGLPPGWSRTSHTQNKAKGPDRLRWAQLKATVFPAFVSLVGVTRLTPVHHSTFSPAICQWWDDPQQSGKTEPPCTSPPHTHIVRARDCTCGERWLPAAGSTRCPPPPQTIPARLRRDMVLMTSTWRSTCNPWQTSQDNWLKRANAKLPLVPFGFSLDVSPFDAPLLSLQTLAMLQRSSVYPCSLEETSNPVPNVVPSWCCSVRTAKPFRLQPLLCLPLTPTFLCAFRNTALRITTSTSVPSKLLAMFSVSLVHPFSLARLIEVSHYCSTCCPLLLLLWVNCQAFSAMDSISPTAGSQDHVLSENLPDFFLLGPFSDLRKLWLRP